MANALTNRVLAKLQVTGELANAYLIYSSDQAMTIARHGLQEKQNFYKHTWRAPFFVKGSGLKPGIRGVKEGDSKLIQCDVMKGAVRENQLFDLREYPPVRLLASFVGIDSIAL